MMGLDLRAVGSDAHMRLSGALVAPQRAEVRNELDM